MSPTKWKISYKKYKYLELNIQNANNSYYWGNDYEWFVFLLFTFLYFSIFVHNECVLFYNIKTQSKRCVSEDFVARLGSSIRSSRILQQCRVLPCAHCYRCSPGVLWELNILLWVTVARIDCYLVRHCYRKFKFQDLTQDMGKALWKDFFYIFKEVTSVLN